MEVASAANSWDQGKGSPLPRAAPPAGRRWPREPAPIQRRVVEVEGRALVIGAELLPSGGAMVLTILVAVDTKLT